MNNSKKLGKDLLLGFTIHGESGPCFQPKRLDFWQKDTFKKFPPGKPFHYKTDALIGLACLRLFPNMIEHNENFAKSAWQTLEPHIELYQRSKSRVQSLKHGMSPAPFDKIQKFCTQTMGIIHSVADGHSVDVDSLTGLIDVIDQLEIVLELPILFNFHIELPFEVVEKLHFLYSLLFNIRALVAMDYDAHVQDPSYESIKVDSITDYLAKAEYVANDAILYHKVLQQKKDIPRTTFSEIQKTFWRYSHHATCLIESIPSSFLSKVKSSEMEEALYGVQMDWLLGSDAGLLFRVREELFAFREGYDQIFWPELAEKTAVPQNKLQVSCQVTEEDLFPDNAAA